MEENKNYSDGEEEEEEDSIPEDPDALGHALIRAAANGDLADAVSLIKRKANTNYVDKKS